MEEPLLRGITVVDNPPQEFLVNQNAPINARMTVQDMLYYAGGWGDPVDLQSNFSVPIEGDLDPYLRPNITVRDKWMPLDTGWVKEVRMLMVKHWDRATEASEESFNQTVVEVGVAVESMVVTIAYININESVRFQPKDAGQLRLRCVNGSMAHCTVLAIPRKS